MFYISVAKPVTTPAGIAKFSKEWKDAQVRGATRGWYTATLPAKDIFSKAFMMSVTSGTRKKESVTGLTSTIIVDIDSDPAADSTPTLSQSIERLRELNIKAAGAPSRKDHDKGGEAASYRLLIERGYTSSIEVGKKWRFEGAVPEELTPVTAPTMTALYERLIEWEYEQIQQLLGVTPDRMFVNSVQMSIPVAAGSTLCTEGTQSLVQALGVDTVESPVIELSEESVSSVPVTTSSVLAKIRMGKKPDYQERKEKHKYKLQPCDIGALSLGSIIDTAIRNKKLPLNAVTPPGFKNEKGDNPADGWYVTLKKHKGSVYVNIYGQHDRNKDYHIFMPLRIIYQQEKIKPNIRIEDKDYELTSKGVLLSKLEEQMWPGVSEKAIQIAKLATETWAYKESGVTRQWYDLNRGLEYNQEGFLKQLESYMEGEDGLLKYYDMDSNRLVYRNKADYGALTRYFEDHCKKVTGTIIKGGEKAHFEIVGEEIVKVVKKPEINLDLSEYENANSVTFLEKQYRDIGIIFAINRLRKLNPKHRLAKSNIVHIQAASNSGKSYVLKILAGEEMGLMANAAVKDVATFCGMPGASLAGIEPQKFVKSDGILFVDETGTKNSDKNLGKNLQLYFNSMIDSLKDLHTGGLTGRVIHEKNVTLKINVVILASRVGQDINLDEEILNRLVLLDWSDSIPIVDHYHRYNPDIAKYVPDIEVLDRDTKRWLSRQYYEIEQLGVEEVANLITTKYSGALHRITDKHIMNKTLLLEEFFSSLLNESNYSTEYPLYKTAAGGKYGQMIGISSKDRARYLISKDVNVDREGIVTFLENLKKAHKDKAGFRATVKDYLSGKKVSVQYLLPVYYSKLGWNEAPNIDGIEPIQDGVISDSMLLILGEKEKEEHFYLTKEENKLYQKFYDLGYNKLLEILIQTFVTMDPALMDIEAQRALLTAYMVRLQNREVEQGEHREIRTDAIEALLRRHQ